MLGVSIITFWQALGILVLSKILFGGFYGGSSRGRCGYDMREKWMHLSSEEKEELKKKWRSKLDESGKAEPQH